MIQARKRLARAKHPLGGKYRTQSRDDEAARVQESYEILQLSGSDRHEMLVDRSDEGLHGSRSSGSTLSWLAREDLAVPKYP